MTAREPDARTEPGRGDGVGHGRLLDEFDTLETWWETPGPSAKRELLAALTKHFIVMAPEQPAALLLQWRHNG